MVRETLVCGEQSDLACYELQSVCCGHDGQDGCDSSYYECECDCSCSCSYGPQTESLCARVFGRTNYRTEVWS